jgi:protein-S-isoprenylcysteine O-methyltransferase Ste14
MNNTLPSPLIAQPNATKWGNRALTALAVLFCIVGIVLKLHHFITTHNWASLGIVVFYLSFCRFFVFRAPSQKTCTDPLHWFIAFIGTWLPVAMQASPLQAMPVWQPIIGLTLQAIAIVWMNISILQLGKGFGIIAALRQVQTQGLYRYIRHPLYAAELLHFAALVILGPTLWNVAIFTIVLLCQWCRATQEELILSHDPAYATYLQQVPYRFVPGVI